MNYRIEYSENVIDSNENFSIKIISSQDDIKTFSEFPNLANFRKVGIQKSSSCKVINGKLVNEYIINQLYQPLSSGISRLDKFEIEIDTHRLIGSPISIIVKHSLEGKNTTEDSRANQIKEKLNQETNSLNSSVSKNPIEANWKNLYGLMLVSISSIVVFFSFFSLQENKEKIYYNVSGFILLLFANSVLFHFYFNTKNPSKKTLIQLLFICFVFLLVYLLVPENQEFVKSYKGPRKFLLK